MGAENFPNLAVHVDQVLRSGGFVQASTFCVTMVTPGCSRSRRASAMCAAFGLTLGVRAAAHVVEIVHEIGIGFEAFGCSDITPIVFGPDACWIAEGRQAAFGGQARAGEDENVFVSGHDLVRYRPVKFVR